MNSDLTETTAPSATPSATPSAASAPTPTSRRALVGPGFDIGSLLAGVLFLAMGIAFMLEADGRWTFELSHFRYIGPLILILIGLATLVGAAMARSSE